MSPFKPPAILRQPNPILSLVLVNVALLGPAAVEVVHIIQLMRAACGQEACSDVLMALLLERWPVMLGGVLAIGVDLAAVGLLLWQRASLWSRSIGLMAGLVALGMIGLALAAFAYIGGHLFGV